MTDPIRKTLTVPLEPRAAFDLFTAGIDTWWPKESHSLSESAAAAVRVEPRLGGRILEMRPDGTEAQWARVTAWEPGRHFAIDWHVGGTETEATQVDVTFTPTDAGTRVDLVHDGFDRLAGGEIMCENYRTGWDTVFGACYGGACAKRAA